jgi:hypothetical protein
MLYPVELRVRVSSLLVRGIIVTNETAADKSLRTGLPTPWYARWDLERDDSTFLGGAVRGPDDVHGLQVVARAGLVGFARA